VDIFKDFWYGLLKPLRDLVSALCIYALTIGGNTVNTTIQNTNFSFNIWAFTVFFIAISSMWELSLGAVYDLKQGYKDPIDSASRIMGMFIGTVVLGFILIPIYSSIGGDVGDLFTSGIISAICMFAGMVLRLYLNDRHYN
jgi:hypothetical protein